MNAIRGFSTCILLLPVIGQKIKAPKCVILFHVKELLLLLVCISSPVVSARAGEFVFEKIADTSTMVPGSNNAFGSFGNYAPAIEDGRVVLFGSSLGTGFGLYSYTTETGLTKVANATDPPSSFAPFSPPSLDEGEVAFYSAGFPEVLGIYTTEGGVHKRYGTSTSVPNATGTFTNFSFEGASLSQGNVAFKARNGINSGVYTDLGGSLRLVADETIAVSGSDTFSDFDDPVIEDSGIFFAARLASGNRGIYAEIDTVLTTIADSNTIVPIPGGSTFFDFSSVTVNNGTIAFVGFGGGNNWGVFSYDLGSGQLDRIVDGSFARPEGGGNFGILQQVSLYNDQIAFKSVGHGLYANFPGSLTRVLGIGEVLDGRIVSDVRIGREGLSGSNIVLTANFEDGSSGVFVATHVPEPTSFALGLLLIALCGSHRHRLARTAMAQRTA